MIKNINFLRLRNKYQSAKPFHHIVIDNFFQKEVANYLEKNFPNMDQMPTVFKEPMSYKGQLSDIDKYWPKFSEYFTFLQSMSFRNSMTKITGIKKLLKDDILAGGGLHQSPRSGFLDIHVDANKHPFNKTLHRRLNIIIYLNKNWKEDYGGAIELWSNNNLKPDKLVKKVIPKFNRAVIFATTRTTWHGVEEINCPEGVTRKSIALYYYTKNRPKKELYEDSSVIWFGKSRLKKIIYPVLNFTIKKLKPYAKYIRRNVFDANK